MVEVALMVEGQSGLTWPRWQRLVRAAEELGFAALYRSDHLISAQPPDEAALELWTSLTWLACNTRRIAFGPLVSPLTFRHPVHLAQAAASLDELSDGRFTLGLGAGWSRREHAMYGFEMFTPADRLDRLEDGLQVITGLRDSISPVTFSGKYFALHEAVLVPRRRPQILVAGAGRKRSLPLAARFADAWNVMFVSPEQLRELNTLLDELLQTCGRKPEDLKRTVMQGVDTDAGTAATRKWMTWREPGLVTGSPAQMRDTLAELELAGAQQVILQWLDLDDVDGLEGLARAVL